MHFVLLYIVNGLVKYKYFILYVTITSFVPNMCGCFMVLCCLHIRTLLPNYCSSATGGLFIVLSFCMHIVLL